MRTGERAAVLGRVVILVGDARVREALETAVVASGGTLVQSSDVQLDDCVQLTAVLVGVRDIEDLLVVESAGRDYPSARVVAVDVGGGLDATAIEAAGAHAFVGRWPTASEVAEALTPSSSPSPSPQKGE